MILIGCIILFIIGSCLEASGRDWERSERRARQEHRELMAKLEERSLSLPKKEHREHRRYARDKYGNELGEEFIEELER